jgi:membrane protein
MMVRDLLKNVKAVIAEAFISFRKNNDLSAASSLAFSATLALIPVLLSFTLLLGVVIGSSSGAMARTQELLLQLIPAHSQDILREVQSLASHRGAIGLLNIVVLLWRMTSLVGEMRKSLGIVFQKKQARPFVTKILLDVTIGILFLIGLTAIAVTGIVLTLVEQKSHLHPLGHVGSALPFLFITTVVFLFYRLYSDGRRIIHLVVGALAASLLWFVMRPAFHLFLLYNPGYGFAFGSFKSLFVVIIWIHFSLVVFLAGAEIAVNLGGMERSSRRTTAG